MRMLTKLTPVLVIGLLALALAMGAGTVRQRQSQAQLPETEQEDAGPGLPSGSSVQTSAEQEQPQLEWDSSSEPGFTPGEAQSAVPEGHVDATAYLRVTGSALKPRDNDVVWQSDSWGGCGYASSGDASTVWNTPLYLPQGATVTMLRMYVDDTSADNCWGWFTVYDLYGEIVAEWGVQSSGTPGEAYFDVDIPDYVIDYGIHSYLLNWRPLDTGSDMQLCGFRVFYTPPPGSLFLPGVMRNYP